MTTKTFKIGEYAVGGIIKVTTSNDEIIVKTIDWETKDELSTYKVNPKKMDARYDMLNVLNEITTHYYSERILEWIEAQITFKTEFTW